MVVYGEDQWPSESGTGVKSFSVTYFAYRQRRAVRSLNVPIARRLDGSLTESARGGTPWNRGFAALTAHVRACHRKEKLVVHRLGLEGFEPWLTTDSQQEANRIIPTADANA